MEGQQQDGAARRAPPSQRSRSNGIKYKMKPPDNVKSTVQQANKVTLGLDNLELDENITENIETLKEQVEIAIKSVDENLIDSMLVGQTKIQKNKAVILSWSLDQNGPTSTHSLDSSSSSSSKCLNKDEANTQALHMVNILTSLRLTLRLPCTLIWTYKSLDIFLYFNLPSY